VAPQPTVGIGRGCKVRVLVCCTLPRRMRAAPFARRQLCPGCLCGEAQQAQVLLREDGRASGGVRLPRALPCTAKAATVIACFGTEACDRGAASCVACMQKAHECIGLMAGQALERDEAHSSAPLASAHAVCGQVRERFATWHIGHGVPRRPARKGTLACLTGQPPIRRTAVERSYIGG